MTTPTHTLATSNARFTASDTPPPPPRRTWRRRRASPHSVGPQRAVRGSRRRRRRHPWVATAANAVPGPPVEVVTSATRGQRGLELLDGLVDRERCRPLGRRARTGRC